VKTSFLQNLANNSFMENPSYRSKSYFSSQIWWNFAKQKHWKDDKDPDKVADIKCLGLFWKIWLGTLHELTCRYHLASDSSFNAVQGQPGRLFESWSQPSPETCKNFPLPDSMFSLSKFFNGFGSALQSLRVHSHLVLGTLVLSPLTTTW